MEAHRAVRRRGFHFVWITDGGEVVSQSYMPGVRVFYIFVIVITPSPLQGLGFSVIHEVQPGAGVHPASCSLCAEAMFPQG